MKENWNIDRMGETPKILDGQIRDLENRILSGEFTKQDGTIDKDAISITLRTLRSIVTTAFQDLYNYLQIDIPTQLNNSNGFDILFRREMSRVNRKLREIEEQKKAGEPGKLQKPYSFVIAEIDMDYLKRINDNYGHHVGNECIADLAKIIRTTAKRLTDIKARVGGDEFYLIIPEKRSEEVIKGILEPIRDNFYEISKKIFSGRKPLHINGSYKDKIEHGSVSIGLTECPSLSKTESEVIIHVEKALYQAKAKRGTPNEKGILSGHIVAYQKDY